MSKKTVELAVFYYAAALVAYMPVHIFLSQWLSTYTGGLEVWKAAKDVVLVLSVFPLLYIAYRQGSFKDKFFKRLIGLGVIYVTLYALFLLFDKNADTKSAIIGSVYNTRLLGCFLLGWAVAKSENGKVYTKKLLQLALIMCGVVASFGVVQYFLPKDFLTHFGYSVARGVKPIFYIDDKPDFPRVMSTLRDPNSLGAFLALPITYSFLFLFVKKGKQTHKVFSDRWLKILLAVSVICLVFTFSRSGLVTVFASLAALLVVSIKNKKEVIKKYAPLAVITLVISALLLFVSRNTYTVQNLIMHADKSTVQEDPNELRLSLGKKVAEHIKNFPFGEGPGTAGLVSINNPKGTQLTENYYLQIAYEVGLLGLAIFLAIYGLILFRLYKNGTQTTAVLFSTGLGILVFGLLNHSWSNEALALQWWILAGVYSVKRQDKYPN